MTTSYLRSLPILFLLLSGLFMVSCEPPELGEKKVTPDPRTDVTTSGSPAPAPATGAPTAPTSGPDSPSSLNATYKSEDRIQPELEVYLDGKTLVVKGALKSRLQKEKIVTDLTSAFDQYTVDNQVLVEAHRYPVGWGSRVSDGFLIPYFSEIKEPYVAYREGVVIMKGKGGRGSFRKFQELAVNVFADMLLKDLDNTIEETE